MKIQGQKPAMKLISRLKMETLVIEIDKEISGLFEK